MSLQVWLPLTKDLRNQGLANVTVTNNGATFNSEGKLGGCYSFDGVDDAITIGNLSTLVTDNFSFICWFYHDDTWSSKNYETIFGGPSGFELETKSGSTNSPVIRAYSWGQGTFTYELNKWNHLVMTRTTSETKFYLNGELKLTGTAGTIPSGNYFVGSWKSTTGQNFKGKVNDVRIYDHCLSPMEVKELAKGLVLHYPLSDEYIESTTNLVRTEDGLSNTCYNGATSKYNYGTSTDMYKTLGVFEGRKSTKVYMGTAGLNAYPFVYFDNFNAASTTIQTLSFDYYPTIQNTLIPYSYNGWYNFSYTTDKTSGSANNTNQITIPVEVGRWNHITVTAQRTDTTITSRGIGYIKIGSASHISTTSNYWLFSNVQVEAKDHATGYAGVGGTRNSTTVYDCSGFCNNGTISGALTISNDTPRYSYSIQMPAAATISHTRCLDNTNQEWSCAAWVKPTTTSNYQSLNNFNVSNRLYNGTYPLLYLNEGTNDYYNYGNLALPVNQWSHIVFVFKNSTGTKLIYINGENHTNTGGPNKTSTPKGIPDTVIIGGGNYEGGLCDYREYATALSEDDVKSLYNNNAYIDSDGKIYGKIR